MPAMQKNRYKPGPACAKKKLHQAKRFPAKTKRSLPLRFSIRIAKNTELDEDLENTKRLFLNDVNPCEDISREKRPTNTESTGKNRIGHQNKKSIEKESEKYQPFLGNSLCHKCNMQTGETPPEIHKCNREYYEQVGCFVCRATIAKDCYTLHCKTVHPKLSMLKLHGKPALQCDMCNTKTVSGAQKHLRHHLSAIIGDDGCSLCGKSRGEIFEEGEVDPDDPADVAICVQSHVTVHVSVINSIHSYCSPRVDWGVFSRVYDKKKWANLAENGATPLDIDVINKKSDTSCLRKVITSREIDNDFSEMLTLPSIPTTGNCDNSSVKDSSIQKQMMTTIEIKQEDDMSPTFSSQPFVNEFAGNRDSGFMTPIVIQPDYVSSDDDVIPGVDMNCDDVMHDIKLEYDDVTEEAFDPAGHVVSAAEESDSGFQDMQVSEIQEPRNEADNGSGIDDIYQAEVVPVAGSLVRINRPTVTSPTTSSFVTCIDGSTWENQSMEICEENRILHVKKEPLDSLTWDVTMATGDVTMTTGDVTMTTGNKRRCSSSSSTESCYSGETDDAMEDVEPKTRNVAIVSDGCTLSRTKRIPSSSSTDSCDSGADETGEMNLENEPGSDPPTSEEIIGGAQNSNRNQGMKPVIPQDKSIILHTAGSKYSSVDTNNQNGILPDLSQITVKLEPPDGEKFPSPDEAGQSMMNRTKRIPASWSTDSCDSVSGADETGEINSENDTGTALMGSDYSAVQTEISGDTQESTSHVNNDEALKDKTISHMNTGDANNENGIFSEFSQVTVKLEPVDEQEQISLRSLLEVGNSEELSQCDSFPELKIDSVYSLAPETPAQDVNISGNNSLNTETSAQNINIPENNNMVPETPANNVSIRETNTGASLGSTVILPTYVNIQEVLIVKNLPVFCLEKGSHYHNAACTNQPMRIQPTTLMGREMNTTQDNAWLLPKSSTNHGINLNEGKKYPCDYCGKMFASEHSVARHVRVLHTKTTRHRCCLCDLPCPGPSERARHELTHSDFDWIQSGLQPPDLTGDNIHAKEHRKRLKYRQKRLSQRSDKSDTIHVKSEKVRFKCRVCNLEVTTLKKLAAHEITHRLVEWTSKGLDPPDLYNGETLHGKEYKKLRERKRQILEKRAATLKSRSSDYAAKFKEICKYCSKVFREKIDLDLHMDINHHKLPDHAYASPYFWCKICKFPATSKTSLIRHELLHREFEWVRLGLTPPDLTGNSLYAVEYKKMCVESEANRAMASERRELQTVSTVDPGKKTD